jgi:hypothetical protein
MEDGFSEKSKALRRALLEHNAQNILQQMLSAGLKDPVGIIIDMTDAHGQEMAKAILEREGKSPEDIEQLVDAHSGQNVIPTLKIVIQFDFALALLGASSPTAKQNLGVLRPPGTYFIVAVGGGGNSYMQVSKSENDPHVGTTRKEKQPDSMIISIARDETDAELIDFMRGMKAARESGIKNIVCLLGGYENDPREVWQIPEAVATCKRLVSSGFISYLDTCPSLDNAIKNKTELHALGAMEVWLIAEGRMKKWSIHTNSDIKTLLDEMKVVQLVANEVADNTIGPMKS